jgi:mono/diheme cytochrome c family protein
MNRNLLASLSSALLKKAQMLSILVVVLLVASCSNQPAGTPIPTRTQIPTFAYVSPTPVAQVVTAVATRPASSATEEAEVAAALDPAAVEAGLGRYTALECAGCHGENGTGGEAPALVGFTMSEDDFVTYMRNGGPLGTAHQYQSNRLSDRGAANLYIYLKSLS